MQVMQVPVSSFSVAVCWFLGLQVSNIGTLCEAPQHRRVSPPVAPPRAPPSALTSRPTIGKSPPAHPIWPRFCFPWSSWWRTTLPHFRTEPLHPHANSDPTSHFSSSFILPPVSICLSSAGLCHCNRMQGSLCRLTWPYSIILVLWSIHQATSKIHSLLRAHPIADSRSCIIPSSPWLFIEFHHHLTYETYISTAFHHTA